MKNPCPRCGREQSGGGHAFYMHRMETVSVYVVHDYYGCDTGCCGHRVIGLDASGEVVSTSWEWAHPDLKRESKEEFVRRVVLYSWPETMPIMMERSEAADCTR